MANFLHLIEFNLRMKILQSVFIFALFYLFRFIVIKYFVRNLKSSQSRYRWQKATSITTSVIVCFILLRIWFDGVDSLATYFGFLTAGLAIALKDLIANMAGSLYVVSRHPFDIGDRIQIGAHRGDVIDIQLFQFTILEIGEWTNSDNSTGRIVHVPCGKIFSETLVNYNQAFRHIWNEISFRITFESDWKQAKALVIKVLADREFQLSTLTQEQLHESSLKFMLPIESFDSKVFTYVEDSGVRLVVRYMCDPKQRRKSEVELWEAILEAISKNPNIKFGYPTQRFYTDMTKPEITQPRHP